MNFYTIISNQIGSGNIGKVYQIRGNQPPYPILIAKIFDQKGNEIYKKEKDILTLLSNSTEPFNECIIKIKKFNISLDFTSYFPYNSKYLIFDYLEHGNLSKYIDYMDLYPEISEKFIKLLSFKLLKALEIIHKNNISHNKIDINNIMFDNNFNPIIIHFSEACVANNNFRKDFEELGKIIAKLMTAGRFVNFKYNKIKKYYEITDNMKKKYNDKKFWNYFNSKNKINQIVSNEFIDFFNLLVKTKKVDFEEIFNNRWLKEIKYKDNYYIETENQLKKDFEERYKNLLNLLNMEETGTPEMDVNSILNLQNNGVYKSLFETLNSNRCSENIDEEKNIFNLEIKKINNPPKGILFDYIQIVLNINNINNDCNILNILYNYIYELQSVIKKIDKNIKIDYPDKSLSFNLTFEENNNNENNNDEDIKNIDDCHECKEDNIDTDEEDNDDEDLVINIKLLKYNPENEYDANKERYYLMFNYIQGEICDYYHYLRIIKEKAKSLLTINK